MADKELKSITFPGLPDKYVIGGTDDYADLEHKPQINGVTLSGNKTTSELSLGSYSKPSGGIPKTDLADAVQTSLGKADTALQSVNAGGVAFDDSATYQDGTVGKELSDQKNAIGQLDGGTTGQFLVKASNTDYDFSWVTVPSANGVNF